MPDSELPTPQHDNRLEDDQPHDGVFLTVDEALALLDLSVCSPQTLDLYSREALLKLAEFCKKLRQRESTTEA